MSKRKAQHKRLPGVKVTGYLNYCFRSWPTLHECGLLGSSHIQPKKQKGVWRARDVKGTSSDPNAFEVEKCIRFLLSTFFEEQLSYYPTRRRKRREYVGENWASHVQRLAIAALCCARCSSIVSFH
jgi:hypothetical protein